MNRKQIYLLLSFLIPFYTLGQGFGDTLTIDRVFELLENSERVKRINNLAQIKLLQFQNFNAQFLPSVDLEINTPYQRSIQDVMQPEGEVYPIERSYFNPSTTFNITQRLLGTGGDLTISNSLSMLRNIKYSSTMFSSNWINLFYNQPIFGFNEYKWNKRKMEINNKLDSIENLKSKVNLRMEVADSYFAAYGIQLKHKITLKNIENTIELLSILKELKNRGKVLDSEVKQTEIALQQDYKKQITNEYELKNQIMKLEEILNIHIGKNVKFESPKDFILDIEKNAIEAILLRNDFEYTARLKYLLAAEKIDKTKKEGRVNVQMQLGIGVNSSNKNWERLYDNPLMRQNASLTVKIPLLSWGTLKNNQKIAALETENIHRDMNELKFSIKMEAAKYFNLINLNKANISIVKKEVDLHLFTNDLMLNQLKIGKCTVLDYKKQLENYENSLLSYYNLVNEKYILKLGLASYLNTKESPM
ncbi:MULTISPECIES: TolC family protein [unclassified Sphingobacterium]|uniref:TolC family protein n=1 Tax=unclassified Sphingobacterium TaxID=2609468 RepID=UPI0025E30892|nr:MULTISPECIES: TolC family protein [unclassified Sphingobacterium]